MSRWNAGTLLVLQIGHLPGFVSVLPLQRVEHAIRSLELKLDNIDLRLQCGFQRSG